MSLAAVATATAAVLERVAYRLWTPVFVRHAEVVETGRELVPRGFARRRRLMQKGQRHLLAHRHVFQSVKDCKRQRKWRGLGC